MPGSDTLKSVVVEELWNMKLRALDGSPAREKLGEVGQLYLDDFRRARLTDADAGRLRESFHKVALEADRFPSPATILRNLPPKYVDQAAKPKQDAEPEPVTSAAEAARNLAIIRDMLRGAGLPAEEGER